MRKSFRIPLLVVGITALALLVAFSMNNIQDTKQQTKAVPHPGFAVVELFTSEGCSSCPPADAAVARLLAQEHVYVLGFHVDYWDRLGWKDDFSQAAFSARQNDYAKHFKLDGAYTPQVVVNGAAEFVGSDEKKLHAAVETNLEKNTPSDLNIQVKRAGQTLTVLYETPMPELLHIALIQPEANTEVKNGENHGRTLHHVNIVRYFQTADVKGKGNLTVTIPAELANEPLQLIAFTQAKNDFKIRGATQQNL